MELLDRLGVYGPATATQLAAQLGESSGSTSYHLRQLERYGFVEEDADRGTSRERWWKRVTRRIVVDPRGLDDVGREAADLVIGEWSRRKLRRIDDWRANYRRWPESIVDESLESSTHLRLTPAEFSALNHELQAVLERYHERGIDPSRLGQPAYFDIEVQAYSFPIGEPPEGPIGEPPVTDSDGDAAPEH